MINKASISANQKYKFSEVYFDRTLDEWVNIAHLYLSKQSGWEFYPLRPGAFGYDNLIASLVHLFNHKKLKNCDFSDLQSDDFESMAKLVHDGWVENYTFWRDNAPFMKNNSFKKPSSSLGDERREKCAKTDYFDLPAEEKDKDKWIVIAVLEELKNSKK